MKAKKPTSADLSIPFIAITADASVVSHGVNTLLVLTTQVASCRCTLIDICENTEREIKLDGLALQLHTIAFVSISFIALHTFAEAAGVSTNQNCILATKGLSTF